MNRLSLATLQNVALVLISAASLYLLTEVTALSTAIKGSSSTDQLEALQLQLDRLDAEVNDPKHSAFISVKDFELNQLMITERLDALAPVLEHSSSLEQVQEDLTALSMDVLSAKAQLLRLETAIENRPVALPKAVMPRLTKPRSSPLKPASLPFNILGVDSRGGEIFLVVAAFDVAHLADVVLMRPSTSFMGWRLNSLLADEARFIRPDGASQSVAIK